VVLSDPAVHHDTSLDSPSRFRTLKPYLQSFLRIGGRNLPVRSM